MSKVFDELTKAKELVDYIRAEGENDPVLIQDMIEGETDLLGIASWAINKIEDDKGLILSIKARKEALDKRIKAADKRMDFFKGVLTQILFVMDVRKLKLPEATVSFRSTPQSVVITDEEKVPNQFKEQTFKIKKNDLKAALQGGEHIEGAQLSNGGETLSVRL